VYTYATLNDLLTQVAGKLSDPDFVFWTRAELTIYANDALKIWNSIARSFRDRGVFITDSGTQFYDLSTTLRNGASELIMGRTVTQAQLITQMKYMLMEPNPTNQTSFTDQFNLADLTSAITLNTNEFLLETGCAVSIPADQIINAGSGRITIADDTLIDIIRAQWQTPEGYIYILVREDDFTANNFTPTWKQSPGTPSRFSIFPSPLLTVQLLPPPADTGTLQLQVIASGSIPDDFTPYVLQGALAGLLSKSGPASDPARARYFDTRWAEGIMAGKQVASVLQAYLNEQPINSGSLFNADHFRPNWINEQGTPNSLGILGQNLVAPYPAPSEPFSIMLDVVRNAPVLVNDDDQVPLGREYYDLLINYIVHTATFKCGYAEFSFTMPLYEAFIRAAIDYNSRLTGQTLRFPFMVELDRQQTQREPLRISA